MSRSLLLIVLAMVGCAKSGASTTAAAAASAAPEPARAVEMSRKPVEAGLSEVAVDLDGDGRAEVTNYVRARTDAPDLVLRKDIDLNRDGRVDVRTVFDDGGVRVEENLDQDFDGRADWVDHYINGKRSYAEIDTNFDGSFDLVKYYENGLVRRKERDANNDGRIDTWEYLDAGGNVVKTGRDVDGDGKMDTRDE